MQAMLTSLQRDYWTKKIQVTYQADNVQSFVSSNDYKQLRHDFTNYDAILDSVEFKQLDRQTQGVVHEHLKATAIYKCLERKAALANNLKLAQLAKDKQALNISLSAAKKDNRQLKIENDDLYRAKLQKTKNEAHLKESIASITKQLVRLQKENSYYAKQSDKWEAKYRQEHTKLVAANRSLGQYRRYSKDV